MEETLAEIETKDSVDAFSLEFDTKTSENQRLSEKVIKAKLNIEHLEKMITAAGFQLGQLTTEYLKAQKELSHQQREAGKQKNYQAKEIETLSAELELAKSTLDGRIKRLEKLKHRNAALQHEITNNRYKIFSMHFKSSTENEEDEEDKKTRYSSQNDLSQTKTELSTIATTSDDGQTSAMSEQLESSNGDYSS